MATLSCSLFLALEQSVSPPVPHHSPATLTSAIPNQHIHHDFNDSRIHHLTDGLDDDLYLHDVEFHFYPQN